jgi:signal transduction histidine kinase
MKDRPTRTIPPLHNYSTSCRGFLTATSLYFLFCAALFSCSDSDADHSATGADTLFPISETDSVYLRRLLDQAWNWRSENPDSSFYYATKAKHLAEVKNYPQAESEAYCRLANLKEDQAEYGAAFDLFSTALALDSAAGNKSGLARDFYSIANLKKKTGRYADAKVYTKRAINIWRSLGDTTSLEYLAGAINNLGNIYRREGNIDSALLHFQQGDSIALKIGNLRLQAEAMNGIGYIYETEHAYDKAMAMYLKSLVIEEARMNKRGMAKVANNIGNIYFLQDSLAESLRWYEQSLKLKEEIHFKEGMASTYTNIGSIYEAQGKFDQALAYHLKSYNMQSESGEAQGTASSANNVGMVLHKLGREQEALTYFELALALARKSGGKIIEMEILGNITQSASASGNYLLAFSYADRQRQIRDTIDKHLRKADSIDDLYTEKKNAYQLLETEKEKEHVELQLSYAESAKRQTLVYALIAGIALIFLLFLALWKINREKHRAVIAEQQEQINRQHTEDIIRNQELIVLRSIFDAQQKERQRIATDLHDGLSLKLSTARLYYNLVGKLAAGMNEEERKQYTKGHNILDEASKELREVAHDLVSGKITRFGLAQAVERLCETLQEASGLKIDFYSSGLDNRLDSHSEFQVYQIIQELLANVHRHAKAKHVTVQLSRYNHTLNVLVEDNGQGFSGKISGSEAGIGLKNIRERVQKLNGSLQIDSTPGRGTTVSIDITILSTV